MQHQLEGCQLKSILVSIFCNLQSRLNTTMHYLVDKLLSLTSQYCGHMQMREIIVVWRIPEIEYLCFKIETCTVDQDFL